MNKRLRKKKHFGEFRQLGFSAGCQFRSGLSSVAFDQFTDEFIAHAVEANRLVFGGGGSPDRGWNGIVCRDHSHDSTTDGDRAAVHHWLEQSPEVESFQLSDFWDVWHGADPFDADEAEEGAGSPRR